MSAGAIQPRGTSTTHWPRRTERGCKPRTSFVRRSFIKGHNTSDSTTCNAASTLSATAWRRSSDCTVVHAARSRRARAQMAARCRYAVARSSLATAPSTPLGEETTFRRRRASAPIACELAGTLRDLDLAGTRGGARVGTPAGRVLRWVLESAPPSARKAAYSRCARRSVSPKEADWAKMEAEGSTEPPLNDVIPPGSAPAAMAAPPAPPRARTATATGAASRLSDV